MIKRGDIYYMDFSPVIGSEQGGIRPALIIQNDVGNKHSPTVIVAAITSRPSKADLPTHVPIDTAKYPEFSSNSLLLFEQIRTLDKCRIKDKICSLTPQDMEIVDLAIHTSLGLK